MKQSNDRLRTVLMPSSGRDVSSDATVGVLPDRPIETQWFLVSGGPCSGKTTILDGLSALGHDIVPEAGRHVIEQGLAAGFNPQEIFANQQLLQDAILSHKLDVHLGLDPEQALFIEDGIPESLAYYRVYDASSKGRERYLNLFRYVRVFFLENLPLVNDRARPQDAATIAQLSEEKMRIYISLGYDVTVVPVLPIPERVSFILANCRVA